MQHLFKKYLGSRNNKILEIGCGTGYVLKGLEDKFINYQLVGSEIHIEGIKFAKERLQKVEFIQLDATKMPFENQLQQSLGECPSQLRLAHILHC